MKNELKKIAIANVIVLVVVLLLSFAFSEGREGDLTAFIGLGFLFIAAANIIVGALLILIGLLSSKTITRNYGAAMLLVAAISLLSSLTFCSMTFARL